MLDGWRNVVQPAIKHEGDGKTMNRIKVVALAVCVAMMCTTACTKKIPCRRKCHIDYQRCKGSGSGPLDASTLRYCDEEYYSCHTECSQSTDKMTRVRSFDY